MAASYNELFGLGSHSEDSSLEGWWPLQDDAANTTVVDSSSNGRTGTLQGGDNTSTISTTGPNSWLAKGLDFDGSADRVSLPSYTGTLTSGTMVAWIRSDGAQVVYASVLAIRAKLTLIAHNDNRLRYNWSNVAGEYNYTGGPNLGASGTWRHCAIVVNSTTAKFYLDGTLSATNTLSHSSQSISSGLMYIGFDNVINYFNGAVAGGAFYSRDLSAAEISQSRLGPELVYSTGASIGDDGAYSVGTWVLDSPFSGLSNGTPTYEWVIANAAGSVVDSGSGSSGTADISSEAGNTVYLLVRASNTGGYDVGDHATRTSGYGSSGDGYYEVDSVVAAGGGGGPSIPVFAHHYRQMARA